MSEPMCETAREQYHVMLDSRIKRLNEVTNRLQELSDRISGTHPMPSSILAAAPAEKMPSDVPPPAPSLAEVLECGSAQINDRINHCMDLINEIECKIF